MKKLLLVFFMLLLAVPGFAKDKWMWTTAELSYYSGPVSPQYQSRWTLTVNNDRTAMFSSSGAGTDTSYSFTLTKSQFNKVNKYIKKYNLTTVNPSEMEPADRMIGGPEYTLKLTVQNTNPNYDQPPQIITFPSQQNDTWKPRMQKMIDILTGVIPTQK